MNQRSAADLTTEDWIRVVEEIVRYRDKTGYQPHFILWGGEPLASPSAREVSFLLKKEGFKTALITNGFLIEKNVDWIQTNIDTLYISLDGPAEIHDRLRGKSGLFQQIEKGLSLLKTVEICKVALCTLVGENLPFAVNFPYVVAPMGFGRIFFQNLIYCTSGQAGDYRRWMRESFRQEAPRLDSWIQDEAPTWVNSLSSVVREIQEKTTLGNYPIDVRIFPDEITPRNVASWHMDTRSLQKKPRPCLMPFQHLQINHDGNAHFCVDFNDFSLGNVKTSPVLDLFEGELAQTFRKEGFTQNSLCPRCPWYYNDNLSIDHL
jgi:radical SAM protein with 4Fe4S-binding SPASM domain